MNRIQHDAAQLRAFNRFHTGRIGVLNERMLDSRLSLAQVRVLYELSARNGVLASQLARELGLDPGYVSRLLAGFRRKRWITTAPASADKRRRPIVLTKAGRAAFEPLDRRSQTEAEAMLAPLDSSRRRRLGEALRTVRELLGDSSLAAGPVVLRSHRPGDIGMVAQRHGELYAQEYGWDERFEALVAGILARFIENFKAERERCWIAERDGQFLGCVFVVEKDADTAQLRMLLVEPAARGLGLGKQLVAECVRFARSKRYRRMVLWTNSVLDAARHVYESFGFRLVEQGKHSAFGKDLVEQTWELDLAAN
ncbi:MAG TPA: bifunctional helix-turn-helix transcriptional regulator/GNAT family N-acetyltransferase [Rudaea sp.]|nr:bifunctional helix-turn-helix transcriptional regulator/GNAT family N-acetyltransferase [Rudaea sp.]